MSMSGQAYVAATQGTSFTLYAASKAMGLHLTPEQEKFQAYLESVYPAVVEGEPVEPKVNEDDPREDR